MPELSNSGRVRRAIALVASLALLDASVTFRNVWPTPAIRMTADLSVELAVCVLAIAAFGRRWPRLPRWLAALWAALVVGRYAEVTAPALYGRPINLYWDLRHVSAVAAMLARPASAAVVIAVAAAAVVVPLLLYLAARWAFGYVAAATSQQNVRAALATAAAIVIVLFVVQPGSPRAGSWRPRVSSPVTKTYARQARLLATEWMRKETHTVARGPSFDADLGRIDGADVLLIFIESYGAVSYERPELAGALAASRARFESDIRASGRAVASAYVESPTFGGSSWLAHISLMSGVEVRDEDTNTVLMTEKRDSLVTTFARRGYRTIAIMPGLQQDWPEGAFYGFDDVYGERRLAYGGPSFGWWTIPDQFAIARMDALAIAPRHRAPSFVFFPTTSTHTPFSPTAPYQPDWARVLTRHPYDDADVDRAWADPPDWLHLGPSYVRALSYAYQSLGGYLRLRADRDFVMILLGDHQPPAAVSGVGAPWDVPVHVIASRPAVLAALEAQGFRPGLTPHRPDVARMHQLVPILLGAFGSGAVPNRSVASADTCGGSPCAAAPRTSSAVRNGN